MLQSGLQCELTRDNVEEGGGGRGAAITRQLRLSNVPQPQLSLNNNYHYYHYYPSLTEGQEEKVRSLT